MEVEIKRYEVEHHQKWREWLGKIPYLQFPADWLVQMSPPFANALVRFRVKRGESADVSVYLDAWDALGFCGEPYWEIYPYDGNCKRFLMNETAELLAGIQEILDGKDGNTTSSDPV
jgi:hypothetical protein